jgi:hypothetical protein
MVSSGMTFLDIQAKYEKTIGSVVGSSHNPLCHIAIRCIGSSKVADIDLGLDVAVSENRELQAKIRNATRRYLEPHLEEGEGMRCWLAVSGNPRVNVWMHRDPGHIGVVFKNTQALSLIQYWCRRASCPIF